MKLKHQWFHDAAKFGAGLVTADFLTLAWLSQQYILPQSFMGIPIDQSIIAPGMIIDFCLFLFLVHYGWNLGKIPRLREHTYLLIAGVIFSIIAFAHILRVLYQSDLIIFGWEVPIFLSWIGIAAATYLAFSSFYFMTRTKQGK
ncbi:MAG TPA: hypothetical protein VMU27_01655 [Candidatus Paceibacterota bacterium]|nr:hypothetical protein [Candidatus Paceibacterota bacterium]